MLNSSQISPGGGVLTFWLLPVPCILRSICEFFAAKRWTSALIYAFHIARMHVFSSFNSFLSSFKFFSLSILSWQHDFSYNIAFLVGIGAPWLREYVSQHALGLDGKPFRSMLLNRSRRFDYDNPHGVNRLSAVAWLINRWMQWDGCSALFRSNEVTYIDVTFIGYTAAKLYSKRLTLIVRDHLELTVSATTIRSLKNIKFLRLYDTVHFLTIF